MFLKDVTDCHSRSEMKTVHLNFQGIGKQIQKIICLFYICFMKQRFFELFIIPEILYKGMCRIIIQTIGDYINHW